MGHPAKHLFGLNRTAQSSLCSPDLKRFSSVVIQRHGAVQKHTAVNPVAIHSKLKTVIPSERDSSFLRTCRWGGCSKIILWLCKGQPGAAASQTARAPAGPAAESQSNRRIVDVPNTERWRCSGPLSDSVGHGGIARDPSS